MDLVQGEYFLCEKRKGLKLIAEIHKLDFKIQDFIKDEFNLLRYKTNTDQIERHLHIWCQGQEEVVTSKWRVSLG